MIQKRFSDYLIHIYYVSIYVKSKYFTVIYSIQHIIRNINNYCLLHNIILLCILHSSFVSCTFSYTITSEHIPFPKLSFRFARSIFTLACENMSPLRLLSYRCYLGSRLYTMIILNLATDYLSESFISLQG